MKVDIHRVTDPGELSSIRTLFQEYADSLGFDLESQNFTRELEELPGSYSPPTGTLLLATVDRQPAGCVALRRQADGVCEMKRLYVRSQYRNTGLGRALVERVIQEARAFGYDAMRLDTIPEMMKGAVALYRSFGFAPIPAYWDNPLPGVGYMELTL